MSAFIEKARSLTMEDLIEVPSLLVERPAGHDDHSGHSS